MKICVVGAFGFNNIMNTTGGQPVKTRELYYSLVNMYGVENIHYVETYDWKKKPLSLLKDLCKKVGEADSIIMLPAQNGVFIFSQLLLFLKGKKSKVFYDVIGGWLPELVLKSPLLLHTLKKFNGIWVETQTMKLKLDGLGFTNVSIVPNYKEIEIVHLDNKIHALSPQKYRLCTFSRVMKEKGVEDAVEAVILANSNAKNNIFELDIYGPIDDEYQSLFNDYIKQCPPYIRYKGIASPKESVNILSKYWGLIFATYYEGEGFAGTLIDALASGLPVIASKWKYNEDVIINQYSGVLVEVKSIEEIAQALLWSVEDVDRWINMKRNCVKEAEKYKKDVVVEQIQQLLEAN